MSCPNPDCRRGGCTTDPGIEPGPSPTGTGTGTGKGGASS